ncbi:hypothetical protein AVEN_74974-1 [Araneus ventricosus]|uniref:Uncharacterized protein n=1 Tax=Araneus ventricosus TaxID=182803 RepID=A0A4Y2FV46_ARAVE|nr:hypothetical protein AVEN_74974-1 [Araneus ventricosus]
MQKTLDEDCVNKITIIEPNSTFQMKQSDNLPDYSSMLAPKLTSKQREKLKLLAVLQKLTIFLVVFEQSRKSKDLKRTVKHRINTGDHIPVTQTANSVPPTERRIISEEISKMFDNGVIQQSENPWSSPVVLVKKKDVSWCF